MTVEQANQVLSKYNYIRGNDNTKRFTVDERKEIKQALHILDLSERKAAKAAKHAFPAPVVSSTPRMPEDVAPRGDRPGFVADGQPIPAAINKVLQMAKNREGIPDFLFVVARIALACCPLPPATKAALEAALDAAKAIDTAIEQAPVKPKKVKKAV